MIRVLLPPSETKNSGGRGRPLAERAPHPHLGRARAQVLAALAAGLELPDAAERLLLPGAVRAAALDADRAVRSSRTTPALRRYAGTVYDGLRYAELPSAVQRVADRSVFIFSGLFGIVRGDEPVPDYRVPAKATLPGLGVCGTFWRPVLDAALPALLGRGLVIDLRSSDYAAMWRPSGALAARAVSVRVLSPTPSGGLAVISYSSKLAKGRLAAALLRREADGRSITSADDVAAAWPGRAEVDGTRVTIHTA